MIEEQTLAGPRKPPQYGDDIVEPGEPFTDATLVTIRALLAESDPVPQPKPFAEAMAFGRKTRREAAAPTPQISQDAAGLPIHNPTESAEPQMVTPPTQKVRELEEAQPQRSWRKIEVVEGAAGRNLRRFLMSPRMLSVVFLCGVVAWQPWFIPMLALMIVSSLLLVGALIGQDRMARIMLYLLKRFVWADPSLGRVLQRLLPRRWHPVLYRPVSEEQPWDGLIDSTFEERLARIRS